MADSMIKAGFAAFLVMLTACSSLVQGQTHVSCNRTYTKIGCFEKVRVKLFDKLVVTDRDWTAEQYGGQDIDWFDWENYLHGLACRCVARLRDQAIEDETVYHHFSLSNYGECWTSRTTVYNLHLLSLMESCVGGDFLTCQRDVENECMGTDSTQYVYHVDEEPMEEHEHHHLLNETCHEETVIVCSSTSSSLLPTTTTKT